MLGGTTLGMLAANAPVVYHGKAIADRLPVRAIHVGASALFLVVSVVSLLRGFS